MKIDAVKFGIAFGIVYAVVFFLYGIMAALFGWGAQSDTVASGGLSWKRSEPV